MQGQGCMGRPIKCLIADPRLAIVWPTAKSKAILHCARLDGTPYIWQDGHDGNTVQRLEDKGLGLWHLTQNVS
jgi:hypothetical protein